MKLIKSMLLRGMDRVKKIKPLDFIQPIINKGPYTSVLSVDFTLPVNSPSTGSIQKSFRALRLGANPSEFVNCAFPAHYALVWKQFALARAS